MLSLWKPFTLLCAVLLCGQSTHVLGKAEAYDLCSQNNANAKRIAIIGAGAGGASTAYHLQQFAASARIPINITVFEKSSYIGGRSTTVNAYGSTLEPVELGASIFVDVNAILKNSSAKFGLKAKAGGSDEDQVLGIWNGRHFVYMQKDGGWKYWDLAKLLWKYGLSPIRTQNLMKKTVGQFLKLYEPPFFPFRSLSDRALDLGLVKVTATTGAQLLAENKIYPPFSTDIIQASTRVNYGQNLNSIHGLETMVCMAIDGAVQIEGGNWQIFSGMLNSSLATTLLNTKVTSVSKLHGRYILKTSTLDAITKEIHSAEQSYDAIVLAAPLQYTDITIEDDILKNVPDVIPYVRLHVSLFTTKLALSPGYFNLTPDAEVPTTILTTLPVDEIPSSPQEGCGSPGFFSISTLRTVINPHTLEPEKLYKIFSPHKLTSEFLTELFGSPIPSNLTAAAPPSSSSPITWYYPHVWNSYPYELPRVTFEEIELARGFYYTSGIESFISTMETSALMGMNVARLVVDDLEGVMAEGGKDRDEGVRQRGQEGGVKVQKVLKDAVGRSGEEL